MKKLHIKDYTIIALAFIIIIMSAANIFLFAKLLNKNENDIEVERKFLLDLNNLPEDMSERADIFEIIQTYLNYSPEMRVRKLNDNYFYYTMKLPEDDIGLARKEVEMLISEDEYNELITKQVGTTIYKTRYQFYEKNALITVDVYFGSLTGLAVAEVEFENVKKSEKYNPPEWFGKEITSDLRYKNANLARYGIPEN